MSVLPAMLTVTLASSAVRASAGSLRRCAATSDVVALRRILDTGWTGQDVDRGCDGSGKSALHHAAWRGSPEVVRALLELGADPNLWSTGSGNYGKTPIFYALTRCRDEVAVLLLEHGAWVRIVNNKGQSVRSLAASHCSEETVLAIEAAEASEPREWLNFRQSHSDGCSYGDLDPRHVERPLRANDVVTERVINPTTRADRVRRSALMPRHPPPAGPQCGTSRGAASELPPAAEEGAPPQPAGEAVVREALEALEAVLQSADPKRGSIVAAADAAAATLAAYKGAPSPAPTRAHLRASAGVRQAFTRRRAYACGSVAPQARPPVSRRRVAAARGKPAPRDGVRSLAAARRGGRRDRCRGRADGAERSADGRAGRPC